MRCVVVNCTNEATAEERCAGHQMGPWKTETTRDWRDERDVVVKWRAIQKKPNPHTVELGPRANFLPHGAVFWHWIRGLMHHIPLGSEEYREGYRAALGDVLAWAEGAAEREITRRVGNQRVSDLIDSLVK